MRLTASGFRKDVYKILDGVVETGESVEVEHKGRTLRVVLTPPSDLINGDPRDLAEMDWAKEWNPDGNS